MELQVDRAEPLIMEMDSQLHVALNSMKDGEERVERRTKTYNSFWKSRVETEEIL
jgi:hypothetical protein